MKKNVFIFAIACALLAACGGSENGAEPGPKPVDPSGPTNPYAVPVVNGNFEDGLEGWERVNFYNGSATSVEVIEGAGVDNSRCIRIQQFPEKGKCSVGIKQKLTGLKPDCMYRMYARIRYSDIPQNMGRGAVLFDLSDKQAWGSSKFIYGTNLKNWTSLYTDFMSKDDGTAEVVCALGFRYGGSSSGGFTYGTVYFDNVNVVEISDELYTYEGEHIRLFIEPSKMFASQQKIAEWVANLDKMYESYEDLVGAVPHEGRKLAILTTRGIEGGYWALAGYPILWSSNYTAVEDTLNELIQHDTWCFGLMHELGHVFNLGNSSWNWNDEMFANFRMQYGLEQNNGKVWSDNQVYTGREILQMYKKSYDQTLASGVSHDGIHYMLARMAGDDGIGWGPFRQAFRELTTRGGGSASNNYQKFENFLSLLSKYASEEQGRDIDVKRQYFTDAELNSIRKTMN